MREGTPLHELCLDTQLMPHLYYRINSLVIWLFFLSTISLLLHLSWSIHVLVKCLYISLVCTYWLIFHCFRACIIFSFISLIVSRVLFSVSFGHKLFLTLNTTSPCLHDKLFMPYLYLCAYVFSFCVPYLYLSTSVCIGTHHLSAYLFSIRGFYTIGCEVTSIYEKNKCVGQSLVQICECLWIDMSSNPFQ
jgi:hypothetical protein